MLVPAHRRGQGDGRKGPRVIDVLRRFAPAFLREPGVVATSRTPLATILRCRTPVLGGHRYACDNCGYSAEYYNSCGSRHCPQCQGGRRFRWTQAQQALLLPVPHFQVVFTLPAELRSIARTFQKECYGALFHAAAETLRKCATTQLGATLSILAVLHTWSRELTFHPHVHCVVSAGGLTADGSWVAVSEKRLFEVKVLQRLFRGIFLHRLAELGLPLDPYQRGQLRNARKKAARKNWHVWIEAPDDRDPHHLVRYLANYVYQTAISDHRILAMDGATVTFRTRGAATLTLPGPEFVRRYQTHFLPKGLRRVRHYGLLAPGARHTLERARAILESATPLPDDEPIVVPDDGHEHNDRDCPTCGEFLRITVLPRDPGHLPFARGPP